jgi:hypothetical protein
MNNTRARTQRGLRGLPKTLHATWGSASAGGLDLFADRQAVPFKRLLEESLQQVLEGQMTDFLHAAPGKRNPTRSGRRDGHRDRMLVTAMGELRLRLPRDRARQFSSELFDRYQRAETTVLSALATLHLRGVSVARARSLIETLCGRSLSQVATVQVATGVRAALARFADRPIEADTTRLILESQRTRIRLDGVVRAKTILIATGIDSAGRRELLDVELADRASKAVFKGVLRRLAKRGLRGVEVIVRSDRDAPMPALPARLGLRPGSALQRSCRGRRAALLSSHPAGRLSGATAPVVSRVPGSPSEFVEPQAAIGSIERSLAALPPPASRVGSAHGAPLHDPAVPSAGADCEAPALAGQASVIWVRRGVETELGVRQSKPRAGGKQKPARLLAGLCLSLFLLVTGSWAIFHGADTSQESSAAVPAAAPEVPGLALLTTAGLLAASPLPEQSEPRSSRLRLTGVIATKTPDGPGIALISIGDGAANPFRVGTLVGDDLVLKSVRVDRAELGPVNGSVTLVLELTTAAPVVAAADRSRGSLASAAPQPLGAVRPVGSARASNGAGATSGLVVADAADSRADDDLTAQRAREAQYSAAATRAAARRLRIQNQRAMR